MINENTQRFKEALKESGFDYSDEFLYDKIIKLEKLIHNLQKVNDEKEDC